MFQGLTHRQDEAALLIALKSRLVNDDDIKHPSKILYRMLLALAELQHLMAINARFHLGDNALSLEIGIRINQMDRYLLQN